MLNFEIQRFERFSLGFKNSDISRRVGEEEEEEDREEEANNNNNASRERGTIWFDKTINLPTK